MTLLQSISLVALLLGALLMLLAAVIGLFGSDRIQRVAGGLMTGMATIVLLLAVKWTIVGIVLVCQGRLFS